MAQRRFISRCNTTQNIEYVTAKFLFTAQDEAHLLAFLCNWPLVNCLQLPCLQCQACAPSLTPLCLHSSLLHPAPPSQCCCWHTNLYFSALHHCAGVINIPSYPEQLLVTVLCVTVQISLTNKSEPERDIRPTRETAITAKAIKAKADQEEFRQGKPDLPLSWGLANSGQSSWPVTAKAIQCHRAPLPQIRH